MDQKKTIIIRHRRENIKKCSLKGIEKREELSFFTYPHCAQTIAFDATTVVLALDGEELSEKDHGASIVLLDGTWRYAASMYANIPALHPLKKRTLPKHFVTAYPRRQEDCDDPSRGLASIEGLFIAYLIMGHPIEGLLEGYYWKTAFLEKNRNYLLQYMSQTLYTAAFL